MASTRKTYNVTIAPDCPETPDYTYTWGAWQPQTNGTSCGGLEERIAVEDECAAGLGCCINHQETSEVQMQPACALAAEDYASFVLSGVPESCGQSQYAGNGQWQYTGKTADGRPYYRRWNAFDGEWLYMFYDSDCDGDGGGSGKPEWIIHSKPQTNVTEELVGGGGCSADARTDLSTTWTPPLVSVWYVKCGDGKDIESRAVDITLTLANCAIPPDTTHVWTDWAPRQTNGTTCGGEDQRGLIEMCFAGLGCPCANRSSTTQSRVQPACAGTTATTDVPAPSTSGTGAGTVVGVVVPVVLVALLSLYLLRKNRKEAAMQQRVLTNDWMGTANTVEMQSNPHAKARSRADTTHNFAATIDQMVKNGRIHSLQARDRNVPLEISRSSIQLVCKIGNGQFGEVWKG